MDNVGAARKHNNVPKGCLVPAALPVMLLREVPCEFQHLVGHRMSEYSPEGSLLLHSPLYRNPLADISTGTVLILLLLGDSALTIWTLAAEFNRDLIPIGLLPLHRPLLRLSLFWER